MTAMTPAEVADALKVSRSLVLAWIREGRLGHFRAGRIIRVTTEDLATFVAGAHNAAQDGQGEGSGQRAGQRLDASCWAAGGDRMQEPRLVEIKDGWAALGDGWAVFGATPDDARKRYVTADEKHAELRTRLVGSSAPSPREPGARTSEAVVRDHQRRVAERQAHPRGPLRSVGGGGQAAPAQAPGGARRAAPMGHPDRG